MNKIRNIGFIPIIISLAAMSFAQGEYNKVDGFTSATNKLHVDSVLVYRDHADVYWWEFYSDTADILKYQIEWGTKDSISYTDTLRLQPYQKMTRYIAKIQPLNDSTTYFAQFHRDYHGKVIKTKFFFNTPPMANGVRHVIKPWDAASSKKITGIDLYTISGRQLSHTEIVKGLGAKAFSLRVSAPGMYVINYTGAAGTIVKSEKRLFDR